MSHWEFPNEPSSGYEEVVVNNTTPKNLNPPLKADGTFPRLAFVQCQKATARIRLDGGAVTKDSGFMLVAGDGMVLEYDRVTQTKFVADTATQATISVHYFG